MLLKYYLQHRLRLQAAADATRPEKSWEAKHFASQGMQRMTASLDVHVRVLRYK
jgi:hypothetical protein